MESLTLHSPLFFISISICQMLLFASIPLSIKQQFVMKSLSSGMVLLHHNLAVCLGATYKVWPLLWSFLAYPTAPVRPYSTTLSICRCKPPLNLVLKSRMYVYWFRSWLVGFYRSWDYLSRADEITTVKWNFWLFPRRTGKRSISHLYFSLIKEANRCSVSFNIGKS